MLKVPILSLLSTVFSSDFAYIANACAFIV